MFYSIQTGIHWSEWNYVELEQQKIHTIEKIRQLKTLLIKILSKSAWKATIISNASV